MFSMQSVSYNPLIVTFQWTSAASLNLGYSQNGVLGNGLIQVVLQVSLYVCIQQSKRDRIFSRA